MFKSAGLAKMFAGRRKFFRGPHAARGPHVRHLWYNMIQNTMKKVWLACVQGYLLNLPNKRMLRHRSALKNKSNLSCIKAKITQIALLLQRLKTRKIQIF